MSTDKKITILKNKDAQLLKEKVKIVIDGIEINLWQHHTYHSVSSYEGWNKVKSFTDLNSKTSGENGDLVFTGIFQIPRKEALEYAIKLGFKVHSNVSKNTNFVIIGSENVSPSKISKALRLNKEKNAGISFVDENTFLLMVDENLLMDTNNYQIASVKNDAKELVKLKNTKKEKSTKLKKQIIISRKLEGLVFVVSGVFSKFSRDELKSTIEQNGGKVSSSISKKTSYIVAGENMGPSKLAKAEKLEVNIINEDQFLELL
ncbi:MAG: hypothetical protein HRT73_03630 [Flavobacteriales bacterium]|nr:hypothetical protein [Flavobacteriales bacterium]